MVNGTTIDEKNVRARMFYYKDISKEIRERRKICKKT